MWKADRLKPLQIPAICFLAFSIPFPFIYSSVALIACCVIRVFSTPLPEWYQAFKIRWPLWIWVIYYLLHVISYFYSENQGQAAFDLQVKLGILIIPLIIGTLPLGPEDLGRIFLTYCLGISTVALISIGHSGWIWFETGFSGIMFYHNLVKGFDANAVYMAWYTLFSIGILLLFPWSKRRPYIRIPLLALQISFLVLLSSRMLILLFFVFVIPLYIFKNLRNTQITWPKTILALGTVALIAFTLITTENPIKKRFVNLLYKPEIVMLKDYSQVPEASINNTELRLFLWRIGLENMTEHHLWAWGAGNGDVNDLQIQKMIEYKIPNIDNPDPEKRSKFYNINLHNMFLQSLLMLGIGGFILFSFLVLFPFSKLFQFNNWPSFSVFLVISVFFLLQESGLQSHAGVIYYTFFSSIFWASFYSNSSKLKK